jgi:hypothetical protein
MTIEAQIEQAVARAVAPLVREVAQLRAQIKPPNLSFNRCCNWRRNRCRHTGSKDAF